MIPKKILFCLSLALFVTLPGWSQWTKDEISVNGNLNSIDLFSENSGWIVGDNGTMLYKSNNKWITYPKKTEEDLYSICLVGKDDGWAVGSNGIILRFNGVEWENFPSPTKQKLLSVGFRDAEHGIAAGARGTLLVYDNGAWHLVENNIRGNIYSVANNKTSTLLAGGLECLNIPIMTLSSSNEKRLMHAFNPGFIEIKSIVMPENDKIWAVGSYGSIIHYDGTEWEKTELGEKIPTLNSVFFKDEIHGLAVGYSGTVLTHSQEGWTNEVSPTIERLNDACISGNMYYVVGNNGTIISRKFDPILINQESNTRKDIAVETYPNPSSGNINVIVPGEFDMRSGIVTVTNLYGQIVFKETIASLTGGQNYTIDTFGLSNGLYLVKIESSGISSSGKFIVK